MPRGSMHGFWRNPPPDNAPREYLSGADRSAFLVDLISRHVPRKARVLEIGCNSGRNLAALAGAGYRKLAGIEINDEAVAVLRSEQVQLSRALIVAGPVEDTIAGFADDEFGAVFTMAVLEHLHPDSAFVFEEMVRIAPVVVTVEDERGTSPRHVPRDYGAVFTRLGMTEIESVRCDAVPGLGPDFMARVFQR